MIVKNLTVSKDFKDGELADIFRRLDYPALWKAGERRDLPEDVVKMVIRSGGQITLAEANAKESVIVEPAQPVAVDTKEIYVKQYGKAKKARVVFPEGFCDGNFTAELAALGHPVDIGVGEIIDLPLSLLEKISNSGGLYSDDPETINQTINNQGKHKQRITAWQAEQERNRTLLAQSLADNERRQSILAELETLSQDYLTATGSYKQATWQRIAELKQSLR